MAEVSPPAAIEAWLKFRRGPTSVLGVAAAEGPALSPRGFPRVNPLAPDALPLLFSKESSLPPQI